MPNPALIPDFCLRFLLLVLILGFGPGGPTTAEAASKKGFTFRDYSRHLTPPDQIQARAALLVDEKTGEVLYARNPDDHHIPASTTKLMTALISYEKLGFNGNVTIVDDDTRVEPSSVPLIPGETVSVKKLFYALLIASANDSARALARYTAGSTDTFVGMMNARAVAMGCFNTHYVNPNGLPAPAGSQYTSCSDLMRIFRAVIAHDDLRKICSTKVYALTTEAKTQTLHNHNRLLGYYPGMGPAKTGWTIASRHTYAAEATRNGRTLLLTILDSPDKWIDAQILLNWGFAQKSGSAANTTATDSLAPSRDASLRDLQPAAKGAE